MCYVPVITQTKSTFFFSFVLLVYIALRHEKQLYLGIEVVVVVEMVNVLSGRVKCKLKRARNNLWRSCLYFFSPYG